MTQSSTVFSSLGSNDCRSLCCPTRCFFNLVGKSKKYWVVTLFGVHKGRLDETETLSLKHKKVLGSFVHLGSSSTSRLKFFLSLDLRYLLTYTNHWVILKRGSTPIFRGGAQRRQFEHFANIDIQQQQLSSLICEDDPLCPLYLPTPTSPPLTSLDPRGPGTLGNTPNPFPRGRRVTFGWTGSKLNAGRPGGVVHVG